MPLRQRIARFYATVGRTLLFGCGGITPSRDLLELVRSFELRCLRSILGRPRRQGEGYVDWARRSTAMLRTHLTALGSHPCLIFG